MTLGVYGLLILCIVGIAAGQIMLKLAAQRASGDVVALFTSPVLLLAIGLYGLTFFGWAYALRYVDLARAYPFMALSFVIVPLASTRLLGEVVSTRYWIGVILIMSGILVASRS